ncbi:hypothetical protein [Aquimarina mytili]|uniref:Lipocalin-like domain-containing protein n=1 Tax=Aquimarina mytili TaxID=874423 RepID=A0A936ZRR9_9FLAO|nr:hypothetical protein [Aquimarina mytili]MBL0683508.1 hypothetical protein [Aquimarina mytili]
MKKIVFFLFAVSAIIVTSCSNDDDVIPFVADASLIPGAWDLQEIRSENGTFTTTVQNLPITGTYSISGKDYNASVTLTEATAENEPNTLSSTGSFTLVATFSIPLQEPIVIEEAIPEVLGTGEWSVNGNTLTTTTQGESQSYEIIALSAQALTLRIAINEETTVESALGTLTINITGDQFIELRKQ